MDMLEKVRKKKILVISPVPTHPPYSGHSQCILSYSEMLMEAGYDISFLWVANQTCSTEEIKLTENFWKDKLTIYKLNLFQRLIVAFLHLGHWTCIFSPQFGQNFESPGISVLHLGQATPPPVFSPQLGQNFEP